MEKLQLSNAKFQNNASQKTTKTTKTKNKKMEKIEKMQLQNNFFFVLQKSTHNT